MARDLFHDVVKDALILEGWQVTHDPFPIDYGDVQMQIDLGAERLLAAQRNTEKIAVEIKSLTKPSTISEFHTAIGQYFNYRHALRTQEPDASSISPSRPKPTTNSSDSDLSKKLSKNSRFCS
jgi:XisH protein